MTKPRPEQRVVVPLAKLHLDAENPRHDPIRDEDKIIAQLFKTERILGLAKNISRNGGINPLESLGVIEMADLPGHYVVVEGNRRACALKLLHDPQKAPTPAARKALEPLKLASGGTYSVVLLPDRDAARPWLELRHLGAQDGAGVRTWTNTQKTRFARGAAPDTMATEVLDRAVASGWIDVETRRKIGATTLTRYLGNPVVRTALGLGERGSLTFTHAPEEVDIALRQFVLDAAPKKDGKQQVNSRTKAADWKAYGKSLHDRGLAPKTALTGPTAPPPARKSAPKKVRNSRSPDDRQYVVPSDFVLKTDDRQLKRMFDELRSLKPDDFPFSANYLLRAVFERIMIKYAKKAGVYKHSLDDRGVTRVCCEALAASGVRKEELKNLRIAHSNDHATFSMHTLGAAVHGANLPDRKGLIGVWENWEGALKLMLDQI